MSIQINAAKLHFPRKIMRLYLWELHKFRRRKVYQSVPRETKSIGCYVLYS